MSQWFRAAASLLDTSASDLRLTSLLSYHRHLRVALSLHSTVTAHCDCSELSLLTLFCQSQAMSYRCPLASKCHPACSVGDLHQYRQESICLWTSNCDSGVHCIGSMSSKSSLEITCLALHDMVAEWQPEVHHCKLSCTCPLVIQTASVFCLL